MIWQTAVLALIGQEADDGRMPRIRFYWPFDSKDEALADEQRAAGPAAAVDGGDRDIEDEDGP